MATIPVNPGDDIAAKANAAASGDTLSFSSGIFPINATTNLPSNRRYVGTTFSTIKGNGNTLWKFTGGTSTEITGFTFDGAGIDAQNISGLNVHDCIFANGVGGTQTIYLVNNSNCRIDRNTFTNCKNFCIQGYPSNGNTYNYNRFDQIIEPIHLIAPCDNTQIIGNVITGISRHGIECQEGMTHLTISNNYIGPVGMNGGDPGICISCATGGTPPNGANAGEYITIANNVLLASSKGQGTGVEIMGDFEIHVDNNLMLGFTNKTWPAGGILNGTGGVKGQGLNTSGNTIQATWPYSDGDSTPWPVPPRNSVGDNTTGPFPPVPPIPTNAGAGSGGITPPVDIHMTATSTTTSITLAFDPLTGVTALTRRSKNGTDKPITLATLSAGATGYTDTAIQPQWEYVYALGSQTITAQGQKSTYTPVTPTPSSSSSSSSSSGGSSSGGSSSSVGKPWLLIGHSVDGGRTWITDAIIPPH